MLLSLVVLSATALGLYLGLAFISPSPGKQESLCTTKECVSTANILLNNMDDNIDPCDDFYQFACGGFEKRTRIPNDDKYM